MLQWPSITTFTLVKGAKDDFFAKLKAAVKKVVQWNPILTGRVEKVNRFLQSPVIRIIPNSFPPKEHDFVRRIDGTQLPSPKGLRGMASIAYVDEHLASLISKPKPVAEQIKDRSPLFEVDLIDLPDGYAAYVVRMAHCVGDGVTYYNVLSQIHTFLNAKEPKRPIDWTCPLIPTHEIYPPDFSEGDIQKSYGLPFLVGVIKNLMHMEKQRKGYFLLSKKKVQQKRTELVGPGHSILSANDVVTSALCDANNSSDIFAFTMDTRGRKRQLGGNFHCEIPFDRRHARDPNDFRDVLSKGHYYERDKLPLGPFLEGKVGRISSLTGIEKLISTRGMEVVCHFLPATYVDNLPLDAAFVFSCNDDQYLVLHNFRDVKVEGTLLEDILSEPPELLPLDEDRGSE